MGSNNPQIPYVRDGVLYRHDGATICRVASSLANKTGWYDWLEDSRHKSFAFVASNGAHCTVVKERRKGAGGRLHFYWFAYRSIAGKKRRVALGKSHGIDLARLSQAATRLAQLELIPAGNAATGESRRTNERDAAPASPKREALLFGTLP